MLKKKGIRMTIMVVAALLAAAPAHTVRAQDILSVHRL